MNRYRDVKYEFSIDRDFMVPFNVNVVVQINAKIFWRDKVAGLYNANRCLKPYTLQERRTCEWNAKKKNILLFYHFTFVVDRNKVFK